MNTIRYRFFVGEKCESEKLTETILSDINEKREIATKIAKEQGAEAAVRNREGRIIGLAFKQEVSMPHLKYEGRIGYDKGVENSDPWYSPRLNRKEGKALAAIFKDAPAVPDFSKAVIKLLDLQTSVVGRHSSGRICMAHSAAGLGQGQILLKIPDGDDSAVFERVPPWIKEVKESEFLAAQGK